MKKDFKFLTIIKRLICDKDQQGFSLAEVMVAAGMMGALSLVVVNLSQTANKTTKTMSQNVEITEIHSTVLRALSIESACTETMTRFTTGGPALDVDNLGGAGVAITRIAGKVTAANTFPTVITTDSNDNNGDGKPDNEYGDMAGTINIQGIQVENYVETGVSTLERYGSVDIRITYRKGHQSAVLNDNIIRASSYGGVNATKIIRGVQVVSTRPAGDITSCRADTSQFLQSACDMFDGTLMASTVSSGAKCHNIKLFNTPDVPPLPANAADQTSKYGLITVHAPATPNAEGSIKAQGGLVVGSNDSAAPNGPGTIDEAFINNDVGPGQGNALIQNSLSVGADGRYQAPGAVGANGLLVQGAAMFGGVNGNSVSGAPANAVAGDVFVRNRLTVGNNIALATDVPGAAGGLTVQGIANVDSSLYVGPLATAPAPGAKVDINGAVAGISLRATGGSTTLANGTSVANINTVAGAGSTVSINSIAGVPIQSTVGTSNFRVLNSGEIEIEDAGGIKIELATGTGPYRPSYIYNMPDYTAGSLDPTEANEIPTKKWVIESVYTAFSRDADLTDVLSAIAKTVEANPFAAIKRAICSGMEVKTTSGAWVPGNMSPGSDANPCQFNAIVCGDATGTRCSTHYSTNYNATGNITASGSGTFGGGLTVTGNASVSGVVSASIVTASNYVSGTNYIYGGGSAPSGLSGVCGSGGCATRFGRWKCVGGVVVGIANGRILCATNGSTAIGVPSAF